MRVEKKEYIGSGTRYTNEENKSQRKITCFSIFHFNDFSNILEMIWLF